MNVDQATFERIESYLAGTLEASDAAAFETEMANNSALAEAVATHRATNEMIIDHGLLTLKAKIQKEYRGTDGHLPPKNGNAWKAYVASGLALLVGGYLTLRAIDHSDDTAPLPPQPKESIARQLPTIPQEKPNNTHTPTTPTKDAPKEAKAETPKAPKTVSITSTAPTTQTPSERDNKPVEIIPSTVEDTSQPSAIATKKEEATLPSEPLNTSPEATEEKTNENKCDGLQINGRALVTASCEGEKSGTISLNLAKPTGGTPPYVFSIDEGIQYLATNSFENLGPGQYNLTVKDANGCVTQKNGFATIVAKPCKKEYAFTPMAGEVWKFPFTKNASGTLMVYNRRGQIVHTIRINNGYPNQWDGRADNGGFLPMGSYLFIFEATDGTKERGHVSLLR